MSDILKEVKKKYEPKPKYLPRDYQEPIIKSIIDHCKKKECGPALVEVSVGGGKTALYAFVADHVSAKGGKAMILARQGELVEQNSDFAWLARVDNSIYSASLQRKSTVFPVIYGSEGTVARAIGENQPLGYTVNDDGSFNYTWVPDILMIDECHQVNYEDEENQYMKIINFFLTANPKMRIIGGTGSPIRGKQYIVGKFWKERLYELSTAKLVEWGWLVPPIFGFPEDNEHGYDFSSIDVDRDGNSFSDEELNNIVLENPTKTQEIIHGIVERTKDRLGVIIFCSTKKHCLEAAQALPEGSYGIINDSTGFSERSRIYKASRAGEIKFLLNVGVLATGYNNPRIDVICYLRPLDSLTLLIQTMGRGFRIPEEKDDFEKVNCLVLDYGKVMERLGPLYENPILEEAVAEKAKKEGKVLLCQHEGCGVENSMMARRCIGRDKNDVRCEYFFSFRLCENCGTKNDPCARECRNCKAQMIDPNKKLSRQHYTEKDLINVTSCEINPCKTGAISLVYFLENGERAQEIFTPYSKKMIGQRFWKDNFMSQHVDKYDRCEFKQLTSKNKDDDLLEKSKSMCNSGLIKMPSQITHRLNDTGRSIINRKIFND